MKNTIKIFISLLILTSCNDYNSGMNMIFTGDVILDRGVNDEIQLYGDSILINSLKKNGQTDFLIINYEGTFTESNNNQNDLFNFKTDKGKAYLLKQGGVTHASIANNHIYDFGEVGYKNTLDALTNSKIVALGENCKPKILTKGKYKCAVLSASLTSNNDNLCISSIEQLKESIKGFVKENPSIPLVLYIHWGFEMQPKPENWQRDLAIDFINLGVDAIIGQHPHVLQTIEFINEKPVFYSIGNFIADAYLPDTDYSYTVELNVSDKINVIKINPIKLDKYFPNSVNPKEQISFIRKYLSNFEDLCAIQLNKSWMIKPIQNVNFQENTTLWLFSGNNFSTEIKKLQSGSYLMSLYTSNDTSNTICLHGLISEFQHSDINNDGVSDIILGISKKVNFDPFFKKRINIYTYQNKNLQPLWLGTKFIYNLEKFDVKKTKNFNYLTTLEIDNNGKMFQGVYEWNDFGFALTELNQIKNNEN